MLNNAGVFTTNGYCVMCSWLGSYKCQLQASVKVTGMNEASPKFNFMTSTGIRIVEVNDNKHNTASFTRQHFTVFKRGDSIWHVLYLTCQILLNSTGLWFRLNNRVYTNVI